MQLLQLFIIYGSVAILYCSWTKDSDVLSNADIFYMTKQLQIKDDHRFIYSALDFLDLDMFILCFLFPLLQMNDLCSLSVQVMCLRRLAFFLS